MLNQRNTCKRKLLLLFTTMVVTGVVSFGCSTTLTSRSLSSKPAAKLDNASVDIARSANEIEESTDKIETNAKDIIKTSEQPEVQANAQKIIDEKNKIVEELGDIRQANNTVGESAGVLEGLEDDIKSYEEEGSAEARKKLYSLILGMSALGGLSLIGGIILFIFNPRVGVMVAAFGLITSAIAIAGVYYLKWIAIAGLSILGLALVVTLIFMVRAFWRARIYKESHETNVELLESIKGVIPEDQKEEFFKEGGIADKKQSKFVQSAIKETKKNMEKKKKKEQEKQNKPANNRWTRRRKPQG